MLYDQVQNFNRVSARNKDIQYICLKQYALFSSFHPHQWTTAILIFLYPIDLRVVYILMNIPIICISKSASNCTIHMKHLRYSAYLISDKYTSLEILSLRNMIKTKITISLMYMNNYIQYMFILTKHMF